MVTGPNAAAVNAGGGAQQQLVSTSLYIGDLDQNLLRHNLILGRKDGNYKRTDCHCMLHTSNILVLAALVLGGVEATGPHLQFCTLLVLPASDS